MINQSFSTIPISEAIMDMVGTLPIIVFIGLSAIIGLILFSGFLNPRGSKHNLIGLTTFFMVMGMVAFIFIPDILETLFNEELSYEIPDQMAKTLPPSLVEEPIISVSNYSSVNVTDINIDTDILDLGDLLS